MTYWLHRMYHTPFLYKHFHKLHHKYKQPTAFSTTAIHPVELVHIQLIMATPLFVIPVHFSKYTSASFFIHDQCFKQKWIRCHFLLTRHQQFLISGRFNTVVKRLVLKWVYAKYCWREWIGFIWLSIKTGCWLLGKSNEPLGSNFLTKWEYYQRLKKDCSSWS